LTALAIEVARLVKRFGDVAAVDGVSFEVRQGGLFGLLGPNGAGKTTTLNLLTGLARPDTGEIRIAFLVRGRIVRVDTVHDLLHPEGGRQAMQVGALVRFLEEQGAEATEVRRLHPSLEDVFVRITGVEAEAMRTEKDKAGAGA
jgi:ABC-type multidrug transport system ATPase subunit